MNVITTLRTHFTRLLAVIMLAGALLITSTALAHDVPDNLIPNGELETASTDGTKPANWNLDYWGDLKATGTYEATADSEGKAVHVKVTDHKDGDAKWFFDPINVNPGDTYVLSNRYKATADSEMVLQYTDENDAPQYEWLGSLSPSNTWTQAEFSFTVPATVKSVTVFHVMAQNGELWTDDYSLTTPVVIPPTTGNLIKNGSAELAGTPTTMPAAWHTDSWGDLTASFAWDTSSAKDGTKSLHTKVTNYKDGDAKWYFDSVAVSPSTAYVFTDSYKATTTSEIVIQYMNVSGEASYYWLGSNNATTQWLGNSFTFTTPADAVKMTIFHVLASNGELWVDDYKLDVKPAAPTAEITNPSVETPSTQSPSQPAGWQTNSWGSLNANFEYLNSGHTGNRSVKTTVTNYTDGDAKWYFDSVKLTPGKDYRFSDYYQSNVSSRIVLAVDMQDGSINYYELPVAAPSTDWKLYTGTFTMPEGGVTASAYHMLSTNGWLVTDDVSFAEYKATGFTRGLVTLTFDDSWEDNIDTAIPLMDQYGYKSNQFYATTFIQNSELPNALQIIKTIQNKGHEMGSHTITHPDLTTLTASKLTRELRDSKSYLEQTLGVPINYFATPYGAYNSTVLTEINKYYTVHRTVDAGYNSKDNFDVTRLKVQNILDTTSPAEVQQWVDKAYEEHTWLILVYHRVANDPGPYDTTPALFAQQLQVINAKGIPVMTISQALNELQPQL